MFFFPENEIISMERKVTKPHLKLELFKSLILKRYDKDFQDISNDSLTIVVANSIQYSYLIDNLNYSKSYGPKILPSFL